MSRAGRASYLRSCAVAVAAFLLAGCPLAPQRSLDDSLCRQMEKAGVPGLTACIVKGDEVVWSNGYGWANVEERRPATADTPFMIASISKTVTGTALMQLYEDGLLGLDDGVNEYLPFSVRNPNFPEDPITFRMLLSHGSSIRDNWPVLQSLYTQGDSPISLHDFLRGYLVPGGEWYSAIRNFHNLAPGYEWHYSNVGATLVGYLVEVISGRPFDMYCEERIFEPLGMDGASWFLAGMDPAEVAMPYRRGVGGSFTPCGHYGYPDYPDGQLRVSVNEYARFLGAFLNGGEWQGVRILEESTVEEMLDIVDPVLSGNQALAWMYDDHGVDTRAPGHAGGDRGVTTDAFFRSIDGYAIAVFTNGEIKGPAAKAAAQAIELRLIEEAKGY